MREGVRKGQTETRSSGFKRAFDTFNTKNDYSWVGEDGGMSARSERR